MIKKERETDEIFTRTSVRSFSEQMPTDGQIEQILKAAMKALSAANQRPWEFYVVKNRELLSLLSGASSYGDYVKGAPPAIAICFNEAGRNPLASRLTARR